jgi:hypothetical protein
MISPGCNEGTSKLNQKNAFTAKYAAGDTPVGHFAHPLRHKSSLAHPYKNIGQAGTVFRPWCALGLYPGELAAENRIFL